MAVFNKNPDHDEEGVESDEAENSADMNIPLPGNVVWAGSYTTRADRSVCRII